MVARGATRHREPKELAVNVERSGAAAILRGESPVTPAAEALSTAERRILALAAALGMSLPVVSTRRTQYANTIDADVGDDASRMWFSATRDTAEAAVEALYDTLVRRLRERIASHRAQAAHHTARADALDAALTAALVTTDGGAT